MKSLIIYYSLDGNTDFIAQKIAESAGADVLRLKPKKDIKIGGFFKYLVAGWWVARRKRPELLPFDKDPSEYERLFIGTPVWAGNYSPVLDSFFSATDLAEKKIALFCTCGGNPADTLKNMAIRLGRNTIIGEISFSNPLKENKESNAKRAEEWAKEMMSLTK